MKSLLLYQIHQMYHQIQNPRNKREGVILITVLIGVLVQLFLSSFELTYQTNYFIGFMKSFTLLILCHFAVKLTGSYRLFGLMVLLTISMFFDFLNLLSTNWYWLLLEYRFTGVYCFTNIYTVYEVVCVLFSFTSWNYVSDTETNNNINASFINGYQSNHTNCDVHKKKS